MESILRIKVSGAGLLDINGNYDVCHAISKFPTIPSIAATASNYHRHKPEFMYVHLSKNNNQNADWEYGIYLQPLPEMSEKKDKKTGVWVIARININHNNKTEPIILYYAERRNNDNIPPPNGWLPVGGIEPMPKCQLVQLKIPKKKDAASPLKKAIGEANKDESKLAEIMFDLSGKGTKKLNYVNKGDKGSQKIKQLNANPRRGINQPGKKTQDMRRVTG
eukprot:UN00513